jgi:hypothetical protein
VKKAAFCISTSESQAASIAKQLKDKGFARDDISVLFPDLAGSRDFAHEQNTKAPEGAATGGATGAVIGGALGWLVGIGSLAIPGLGPFVAAGPLMAALAGMGAGAAAGGLTGALIGIGIPEFEAKLYDGKVSSGNILMSVHTEEPAQVEIARQIFTMAGANDISVSSEAPAPEPASA